MSKRTPSCALSPSKRKRSKLDQHQGVLETYFRPPSSTGEPSRRTHSHASSSIVSEDGHGTRENPILLDSADDIIDSMPGLGPLSSHARSLSTLDTCENSAVLQLERRPTQLGLVLRQSQPIFNYSPAAVDPLLYPIENCPWPANSPAPYSFLIHTLLVLVETRSRIDILNALTNTLRSLILYHPPSLLPSLYLMSNSLSPAYCSLELGTGSSVISKAIQHVSGLTPAALRRLYNSLGDPGDAAFAAKSNVGTLVAHPPLLIETVYESMLKIARVKGQGAARQKAINCRAAPRCCQGRRDKIFGPHTVAEPACWCRPNFHFDRLGQSVGLDASCKTKYTNSNWLVPAYDTAISRIH
ncbi:ATP-dependent DNA ligase [Chiua virens]|nr:ATP-dependent DNA ligase [Chiua virens]